ncbi:MAG: hypothetical protein ACK59M_12265 [Pseudomonadota bacterium]
MSGLRAALARDFPEILRHEGTWTGTYRHLDGEGRLVDRHQSHVECTFPDAGPWAYVQRNRFTWDDGREQRVELPALLRDGRLWWDVPAFHGSAWASLEGTILLRLERKDEPGAHFVELIVLAPDGRSRARTWHRFRDGRLDRRTLCDETPEAPPRPALPAPGSAR